MTLGIDHWQASDLVSFHRLQGRCCVVLCQTGVCVALGHLADRDAIGRPTSGRDRDTNVAIGDHPGDAAFIVTTGSAPQSPSHMCLTTSARFVSGRQVLTSLVIMSRTFIAFAPFLSRVFV
jgi:hypothetical protein